MNFKPNDNFFWYLYWICERQSIFWKRLNGESWPFTNDDILQNNKFCNTYRVLDRSSQFLISNVIYNQKGLDNEYNTEDIFWRILLYKHFNLPETWLILEREFGDITLDIKFKDISNFLTSEINKGRILYSNAYMLTASFMKNEVIKQKYGIFEGSKKHEAYLQIFKKKLFEDGFIYEILKSKTFEELSRKFTEIITVGEFIAYQYAQDLNYSILFDFDENEFCFAGPGTKRGIERTFDVDGNIDYEEIVKWVQHNFYHLLEDYSKKFDIELKFISLPNREMKVPDFSNCFCETDKYMRGAGITTEGVEVAGKRIKNKYSQQSSNKPAIKYSFPPKWNVKL